MGRKKHFRMWLALSLAVLIGGTGLTLATVSAQASKAKPRGTYNYKKLKPKNYVKTPKSLRGLWYESKMPSSKQTPVVRITKYALAEGQWRNGKLDKHWWRINGKHARLLSGKDMLKPKKGFHYVKSLYVSKKPNAKGYWAIGANNKGGLFWYKRVKHNGRPAIAAYTHIKKDKVTYINYYYHKIYRHRDNDTVEIND